MRAPTRLLTLAVFLLILVATVFQSCKTARKTMNPEFAKYIDAYTAGVISKQSTIRIQLANAVNVTHAQNEPVEKSLFDFSPSIKGKAYWVDATTIEFRPDENLQPGKDYEASFNLSKVTDVPSKLKEFDFSFRVIKPAFSIDMNGLKAADNNSLDKMSFSGQINTADVEDPQKIEQLLTLSYPGQLSAITWQHNPADRVSKFTINNIPRGNSAHKLSIKYDGKPLNIENSGNKEVEVPAIGDFKVLDVRAESEPEQHLLVQFSDPVSMSQSLEGMIGISNATDLRYTISGSEVKVYAAERLEGNYSVSIAEGILNITDKKLGQAYSSNVNFENTLPSVTIPGKGVILPQSSKLVMPFEAVNLKAVDVSIIKIYENNIPQYLQKNTLDGAEDLRRVAKPVVEKTVRLDTDKSLNLHKKNRFYLDLEKILQTEPGAIYRVTIGFRKSYALQTCNADTTNGTQTASSDGDDYSEQEYYGDKIDEDDGFWQRYDSYYPYGYNWQEREDACSNSYYNKERWASRNIIASNMGMIVKRGNDNSMVVAVTDIRDTKPMIGVELELLDYQNQVIFKTKSDGDGLASFDLKRKPYLLIAKKDNERGYLKLDDGSSLPLSRFDVKGEEVQSGIKGFLYGERGVWRPGDSLFLTFVLEDKDKKLPENHPVTFELYTPKGQLYKRISQHTSLNGFYSFATATGADDPTGNWTAKVQVGGAAFTKNLKIETVKPNRLKINLDFGPKGVLTKTNGGSTGTLNAQWLFGATAQNLKAKVDVSLSASSTSFKKWDGYTFDDPAAKFETENKTIFEGPLNESGNAAVKADFPLGNVAPGMLRANFEIKVFEPGGDFSIDHFSLPYHPFESYAGVKIPTGDRTTGMLLTDQVHPVSIVNVDDDGNLIAGTRNVEVQLYKLQWRWWWDDTQNDYSNFTTDKYNKLLEKQTITLTNGKGNYDLMIRSPEWGRYLVRVKDLQSGHVTGQSVYIDYPGWAERVQQDNPEEASMLVFTSDKATYKVGDQITLTIPSSEGGRALVSIESGSKVLKTTWVNTDKKETIYKFKAESGMAPNIYVNVSLLQPHAQTVNDLPIRMYGTIPINIEDANTVLKPQIAMPATFRPEDNATIKVSEANGKAMTYTVAVVDEGLLDLTRFQTPDPHSVFYAREALGVKTWDIFDYVIGAWGGDLERILSIGGDEGLNHNASAAKANRFKPVVKYMGPFYLKSGQTATHSFKLPPYIGSVKVMVVAGQDGAYGSAEKVAAVKKPLMLLTSAPRVLGPGESIQLPVTVFGLEKNIHSASVTLATSPLLEIIGDRTKTVNFPQPGEQIVYFDVKVKSQTGVAKFNVTAASGSERATEEVELNVRNPNPVMTNILENNLQPHGNWSTAFSPVGMAGTNKGVLEISTIPSLNLGKRLNYLIEYPYGCVEQTTSSVFPQLSLTQLMQVSEVQKASIDHNIKAGINRLKGFQTSDGGLSYWPGQANSDEWGTNYAGHFLLEAQDKGYTLPPGMIDQWKKYQRNKAVTWAPNTYNFYGGDLVQSYRLYLLALAKAPELGAMNRLKEFKYISVAAKWRLAAAYKLAGQPEAANSLVNGLNTDVKPYTQMGGTFGSDLRDKSMILETLTLMGKRNVASGLVTQIAAQLSQDSWYSTQTTAYALISIAKYCGDNSGGSIMNCNYTLNGVKGSINSKNTYVAQVPVTFNGAAGNVSLQNNGNTILYARLILQGQPEAGQEPVIPNNPDVLVMQINYSTREGRTLDPATLKQGTDFMATVTIKNPGKRGYYEQMALAQVFPSGWEILNTRLMENDSAFHSSPSSYIDIRDDRVYTFFNIEENKTHTYNVLLNASYLGRYYLPATSCEAMYDNTIRAYAPGKWVEVVK